MSNVFRCPVCYGKGRVPVNFYVVNIQETSGTNIEVFGQPCKSCDGRGILWDHGIEEVDLLVNGYYKPTIKNLSELEDK